MQPGDVAEADEATGTDTSAKALLKLEGRYAQLPVQPGQSRRPRLRFSPVLVGAPNMVEIGPAAVGAGGNAGTTAYEISDPSNKTSLKGKQ